MWWAVRSRYGRGRLMNHSGDLEACEVLACLLGLLWLLNIKVTFTEVGTRGEAGRQRESSCR